MPGNRLWASFSVSIQRASPVMGRPQRLYSKSMKFRSKAALWAIICASPMNSIRSSAISANLGASLTLSSVMP